MTTYYQHSSGCGSRYTDSYIKIEPENKVTISLQYGWMGQGRTNYDLECTLYPISGPYHIIKVNKFIELCKDENKVHNKDAYFDTYIFNEVLETEWFKYPIEDIPIGSQNCYILLYTPYITKFKQYFYTSSFIY